MLPLSHGKQFIMTEFHRSEPDKNAISHRAAPDFRISQSTEPDLIKDGGRRLFEAGVNATITGDMLTTVGNNTRQDQEMLTDMGFQI